jgi:hypothetical protein
VTASARSVLLVLGAACVPGGSSVAAPGSLSISNLLVGQSGNYPFVEPRDRADLYDQLHLDYSLAPVRIGLRYETSRNSEEVHAYGEITQRYAEWSDERIRARVGNLYTILGRGLVHRSFELPGVVLDEVGVRARYGPSRDVDGALVDGLAGPVAVRLFSGTPNNGEHSPAGEDAGLARYRGELTGAEISARLPREARAGLIYARASSNRGNRQREFRSGFVELDPVVAAGGGFALPIYAEYALSDRSFADWLRFPTTDATPHALYGSANLLAGPVGISAEWKDYRDFRTGVFNDPPSLVKEHAWPILNRNTHVLDADDETGFQVEGTWSRPGSGSVTLNRSRSDGDRNGTPIRFEETYVEIRVAPDPAHRWEATGFYDSARDDFVFIEDREVIGGGASVRVRGPLSIAADFERQTAERFPETEFEDRFLSLEVSRAGWGSAAVVWERSTDPEQENPGDATDLEVDPRHFLSGVVHARITDRNEATLFVGERRNGRACTAGTCYEVPPFKGVELRLSSRF